MSILGIDIGTTSVKITLNKDKKYIYSKKLDTNAFIKSNKNHFEQDVNKIIDTIKLCLSIIDEKYLKTIKYVGLSGQMHGVVFWNRNKTWSNLITWMDQRCDDKFINQLPLMPSNIIEKMKVSTGYGCATIFHYLNSNNDYLDQWTYAGNIVDLLTFFICSNEKSIMSPQMAHSWGYFDIMNNCWFKQCLADHGFRIDLLPDIVKTGTIIGNCSSQMFGLPSDAQVFVGMGDLQCSMFKACEQPLYAAINFSTSSQFSVRLSFKEIEKLKQCPNIVNALNSGMLVINPFTNQYEDDFLLVAASLNGGNVLMEFVKMIQTWTSEIVGYSVDIDSIWTKLTKEDIGVRNDDLDNQMCVVPTLFGERFDPSLKLNITNIGFNKETENLSLLKTYRAICWGLINNLYSMLDGNNIKKLDVKRLTCSGGVITRHPIIQKYIQKLYGPPLIPDVHILHDYDACMGSVEYIQSLLI